MALVTLVSITMDNHNSFLRIDGRSALNAILTCTACYFSSNLTQGVHSWNPILTKDSYGSGGSSYRRTRNGELSPPFPPNTLVLRTLVLRMSDYPSLTQPESGMQASACRISLCFCLLLSEKKLNQRAMQKDHGSAPAAPTGRLRHRRRSTEVLPDVGKENGSSLLVNDQNKYRSMLTRIYSSIWMIGGFILILYLGHLYIWAMVVVIQIFMARELFSLLRKSHEDRQLPGFRQMNWHFFFTAVLFVYGRFLNQQLVNTVTSGQPLYQLVSTFIKYHMVTCYFLYIAGFMWFILTLKKKMYKYQFGQYAWTHMILIVVFTQSSFTVANIFEGIFWFLLPASLIVINDCAAYFFGFFFGRTPLIKLSPKKTWEGFIGASVTTIISAFVLANVLGRYEWLTCPRKDLSTGWLHCDPGPLFKPEYFTLPAWIPKWNRNLVKEQRQRTLGALNASLPAMAAMGNFHIRSLIAGFSICDSLICLEKDANEKELCSPYQWIEAITFKIDSDARNGDIVKMELEAVENRSHSTLSCSLLGKAVSEDGIRGCNLPGEVVDPTHPASDVMASWDAEEKSSWLGIFPWREVQILPVQWHAMWLGLFASIIAPFGGFFASGFKRAFKIKASLSFDTLYISKDFGDSIPGHGGITDRMDCQVSCITMLDSVLVRIKDPERIEKTHHRRRPASCRSPIVISALKFSLFVQMVMAVFAYIYHQSFISPQSLSVDRILDQIMMNLTFEEQQALFMKLGQIIQRRLLEES
ncbi:hypothetical protein RHSIM_Rhsim13G0146800 [Rhododendron simsii]|uniref:phosphatidate cytidylyltransferase n=2 Tax=Pentapetalae TaxID=1437201 RepID=A0A834L7P7_RHOSS|nr:hypothetical protein RHSIM_Rhsim13G0146800 [Rhododendron simsii]